jgi:hypothetical protein
MTPVEQYNILFCPGYGRGNAAILYLSLFAYGLGEAIATI